MILNLWFNKLVVFFDVCLRIIFFVVWDFVKKEVMWCEISVIGNINCVKNFYVDEIFVDFDKGVEI